MLRSEDIPEIVNEVVVEPLPILEKPLTKKQKRNAEALEKIEKLKRKMIKKTSNDEALKRIDQLKLKLAGKVQKMVKTKRYYNLYTTLQTHVEALQEIYRSSPALSQDMSLEELTQLYTDIHNGKYGKL